MTASIPGHVRLLGDAIPVAACGKTVPRGTEPAMLGIRIRYLTARLKLETLRAVRLTHTQ